MSATGAQFFDRLLERVWRAERFLITTHRNPDPDGIGAELGLDLLLRSRGRDSLIYNHDPISPRYSFLDPENRIKSTRNSISPAELEGRTVVMVDNADPARSGDAGKLVLPDFSNLIIIDHHDGMHTDRDVHFMRPDFGSTSEMVFELLERNQVTPPLEIARALYAGIVIDTGHFRYRKTRPGTHRIAAKLIELGVEPSAMAEALLATWPAGRLRGRSLLYSRLQLDEENGVAWFAIRKTELLEINAAPDDIDGIVNELLEADEIAAAALFVERDAKVTRVSARSKGDTDLLPACVRYGGGGHKNACGATIPLDLEQAVEEFIPAVASCVRAARVGHRRH